MVAGVSPWRMVAGRGGEEVPVGDLAGAWVCELRGSSGEVVRASIRSEEGYGEVSAEECQWRWWSYVFRWLQGSDGQTKARMSFGGVGRVSPCCVSAKKATDTCCPR